MGEYLDGLYKKQCIRMPIYRFTRKTSEYHQSKPFDLNLYESDLIYRIRRVGYIRFDDASLRKNVKTILVFTQLLVNRAYYLELSYITRMSYGLRSFLYYWHILNKCMIKLLSGKFLIYMYLYTH